VATTAVPPASASALSSRVQHGEVTMSAAAQCKEESTAAACGLVLWQAGTPLDPATTGPGPADGAHTRNFTLYAAAPVLSSGWTLVGDLSKFVPCSPQRFVAEAVDRTLAGAPHDRDLTGRGGDVSRGSGGVEGSLAFSVIGSVGEVVQVTVVAPPADASASPLDGKVVVVPVTIGASRRAEVTCMSGKCKQVQ